MNNVYFGLNNVAEKPSKLYVGDSNGVARKVKKAYLGVNGVAKQVYSSDSESINDWNYTIDGNYIYLNYYLGKVRNADVVIHSSYTINGVTYQTKISNGSPYGLSSNYMFYTPSFGITMLKTITIEQGVDTSECTSLSNMFHDTYAEIYGLEYLDTSNVENFSRIFWNTKKYDGIKNWDTSKGKYFDSIFRDPYSARIQQEIDLTGWDMSSALNTYGMFYQGNNLEHIYIGNDWDLSNVTDSGDMFAGCILLPNFNNNYTDKTKAYVGNGGYLERTISTNDWDYTISGNDVVLNYYKFKINPNPGYYYGDIVVYSTYTINGIAYNTKIASSPISTLLENFQDYYMFNKTGEYAGSQYANPNSITFKQGVDTSSCTSLAGMFRNVQVAQPISGLQYFDTSNVEDMGYIFGGAGITIGDIENWDVSKVKYFVGAFRTIKNSSIDISGWNTSNAIDMRKMFENNRSPKTLEHIYVGNGWNTNKVSQSTDMFKSCELLPNFNSNYTDKTRAYVGSGGYLERKS